MTDDWIDAAAREIQALTCTLAISQTIPGTDGLRAIIEKHAPRWISVEDRLPEHGAKIIVHLVSLNGLDVVEEANFDEKPSWGFLNVNRGFKLPVTHWQPLPAQPKD